MMTSSKELPHVPHCYGCSLTNPVGLKIKFAIKAGHVRGEFLPAKDHEGPPEIVHGGVIAALVDESLSVCCRRLLKKDAMTIKLEMTYRNPAKSGEPLFVESRLAEEKAKVFIISATVFTKDKTIAEASGIMFKMNNGLRPQQLIEM